MELNIKEFEQASILADKANSYSSKLEEISNGNVITKYNLEGRIESTIDQINEDIVYIKNWIKDDLIVALDSVYNVIFDMEDSMVNTDGLYSNLTDYQKIFINYLPMVMNSLSGDQISSLKGKTVQDLINMLGKKSYQGQRLESLGIGEFIIVEYIDDKYDEQTNPNGTDYNGLVIQDVEGNRTLINSCTEEGKDVAFDAYKVVKNLLPNLNLDDLNSLLKSFEINFDLEQIYKGEINKGIEVAEKHFNITAQNGKTLNIAGYSLGGGISEEIYLHLLKKKKFLLLNLQQNFIGPKQFDGSFGISDPLGTLNIYNAYHAYLDDKEVDLLINQAENNKVNMYANVGDMASSIFDYEKYEQITKFIYIDTESVLSDLDIQHKELENIDSDKIPGERMIYSFISAEPANTIINILLSKLSSEVDYEKYALSSVKYLDDIHVGGGPHDIQHIYDHKNFAFKPNGEVIPQKGMSFKEISEELYGGNIEEGLKNTFNSDILKIFQKVVFSDQGLNDLIDIANVITDNLDKAKGNEGIFKQPGAVSNIVSKINYLVTEYNLSEQEKKSLFNFVIDVADLSGIERKVFSDALYQNLDTSGVVLSYIDEKLGTSNFERIVEAGIGSRNLPIYDPDDDTTIFTPLPGDPL